MLRLYVSADLGNDTNPNCGLQRDAPCQSIPRALQDFPQEIWLLGGVYNASQVNIQTASNATAAVLGASATGSPSLLRDVSEATTTQKRQQSGVANGPSNYVSINGAEHAVLRCRAEDAAPSANTPQVAGHYLHVDVGSELFLSNLTCVTACVRQKRQGRVTL